MQKNSSSCYELVKKRFVQAEDVLRRNEKKNFEKIEIKNEVWELLYKNEEYYRRKFEEKIGHLDEEDFSDCFFDTIRIIFNKFDPEKGKLENFFNRQWHFRLIDKIEEIGKRKAILSLDSMDNEKEENDKFVNKTEKIKEDQEAFRELTRIEEDDNITEIFIELLNAIVHLNEHKSEKTSKKKYFKMFYTEHITEHCKCYKISKAMKNKEKSIFAGLHTGFLDFYMKEKCRTFYRIQAVPLKSMWEITKEGSKEEIKIPLANQIYIIYLKVSSPANVTQMKNKYRNFCKELGIKEKLKA